MSNKKQGFSRNLQQEQKEFERKSKQGTQRDSIDQNVKKEEEAFRKRNAQNPDNTRVGSPHTYQKDGYIKEQTGGSSYQGNQVKTSGPESSQVRFNQNVKKEEEAFQKKQKQQIIKEAGICFDSKQSHNPLYHNASFARNSEQTDTSAYHPRFNQNVIKEGSFPKKAK